MQSLFDPLKKFCKPEKVAIDNNVFRLHYKLTVILFLLFTAMLTAKQYFGDPIDCYIPKGTVPASIVNAYCWVHGTYTVHRFDNLQVRAPTALEEAYFNKMGHRGIAHPGIETYNSSSNRKMYHVFYQWVGFVIFIQAIMFYLPRHFWKYLEDGRIKFCAKNMKEMELDEDKFSNRVERLVTVFNKFKGKNNNYAAKFFLCEIINLMNVTFQIFYINKFIGGKFLDYGSRIFEHSQNRNLPDPMDDVFPKVTKCQFNWHGPGGGINNQDALCLLPLNVVNEKIFLAMWVWMIVLAVWSGIAVLYRMTCILFPAFRTWMLDHPSSKWSIAADVCRNNGQYGDWFLLRQLSKNVDRETFSEFLRQLSKEIPPWEENQKRRMTRIDISSIPWVGGFIKPASSYQHESHPENVNTGFTREKNDSGFETEGTDCDSFTMVPPRPPVMDTAEMPQPLIALPSIDTHFTVTPPGAGDNGN